MAIVLQPVKQAMNNEDEDTEDEASFEVAIAQIALIATWVTSAYLISGIGGLAWYWPVGVGLVPAVVVYKILTGPLKPVLTLAKNTIRITLVVFLLLITVYILYKALAAQ